MHLYYSLSILNLYFFDYSSYKIILDVYVELTKRYIYETKPIIENVGSIESILNYFPQDKCERLNKKLDVLKDNQVEYNSLEKNEQKTCDTLQKLVPMHQKQLEIAPKFEQCLTFVPKNVITFMRFYEPCTVNMVKNLDEIHEYLKLLKLVADSILDFKAQTISIDIPIESNVPPVFMHQETKDNSTTEEEMQPDSLSNLLTKALNFVEESNAAYAEYHSKYLEYS